MKAWVTRENENCPRILWNGKPQVSDCGGWEADFMDSFPLTRDQFPEIQPAPGECVEVELTAREVQP